MMHKAIKCEWIGAGEGCELAAQEHVSYCEQHQARVYQKGSRLRRRHKDISTAASVSDLVSMINDIALELESEQELGG